VLGYTVAPKVHGRIIRHQFSSKKTLILVYRGAGKTTVGTIAKAIHYLLKDRDCRILIATKTSQNAEDFLKEIKQHFESNERLKEVFGEYVGEDRWDTKAIQVAGRTRPMKEPSIMTVGVEGAVASKHYDVIIADDLVDEDNSRTQYQRTRMVDWYYKMLAPCLQPPNPKFPYRGDFHHSGTRFHFNDLYGHLTAVQPDGSGGELGASTLVIPALDENGQSPWPERHAPEWFEEKKRTYGLIRFNSQYQCNTDAMKGQIFRYDDCIVIDEKKEKFPEDAPTYMGIDLAIGEKEQHDAFTIAILAKSEAGFWVKDYFEGRLRFKEQTEKIIEFAKRYKPVRALIEANAYQKAQFQEVKRQFPSLNIVPHTTVKDKVSRAWTLASHFENKRVRFRPGHAPPHRAARAVPLRAPR
jgi:phage terminase large subunit-like protein